MELQLKDLDDALLYLGGVAGALIAIGTVVYVVAVRPLKAWLREQIQPAVNETRDMATAVQAEVSPNHGRSLRDAVDRMETDLGTLGQRFTDHITNHPGRSR